MTYNVGVCAALGDLLTQQDLEYLFPHANILSRAMFASVRTQLPNLTRSNAVCDLSGQ